MAELRLSVIAERIKGEILQGNPSLLVKGFQTDSRQIKPGELFFALIAERNGHSFVPHAEKQGAAGAVVSQPVTPPNSKFAIIRVENTLQALQELAKNVLCDHDIKVIGITGSIGKTITKEFTYSFLSKKFKVLKSEKSYNNHIGLPLSLLRLTKQHQLAVLEMGMNHPGEIASLTKIAPPDVALITNIRPVHLQYFNGIEEIAKAKKEILDGLKNQGTAILNGDDPLVIEISKNWKGRKIFFGSSESCEIQVLDYKKKGFEGISLDFAYGKTQEHITLPFFYESYLYNFLAAAAIAYSFSIPFDTIRSEINNLKPLPMRGTLFHLGKDIYLIDDSYNSNPASLKSALKSAKDLPAKRNVAVLGDMLELGPKEIDYHIEAGQCVKALGWDVLITVGPLSRHMAEGALRSGMSKDQIFSYPDSEEAAAELLSFLKEGDLVLVKGSRKMKTEKIVEKLLQKGE
ncbi:MAG: UDP-N-acetylmuramoyl-tripeptide--D-alanyl-D-alanine ligase [Candidatus Aminicenantes bacterium]|nr:UDP-N-acetylmuramoyl-tripeptide--D-alanyl-D-alanine ligase [Candidatus Aminicenantes bacterium]